VARQFLSITVGELLQVLNDHVRLTGDDSLEDVLTVGSDFGDHCHTEQALELTGTLERRSVERSGYSNSGFEILKPRFEKGGEQKVLVLS
jgi:hypothetical protein